MGTNLGASVSASASRAGASKQGARGQNQGHNSIAGGASAKLGFESTDMGITSETANSSVDVVNYDVRKAIAAAERAASRAASPADAFARELDRQVLGSDGLRNRYLEQADSARGTADVTAPLTSIEQSSVLRTGRFSNDMENGPFDGDPTFKERTNK